jgi:hypothetical protein
VYALTLVVKRKVSVTPTAPLSHDTLLLPLGRHCDDDSADKRSVGAVRVSMTGRTAVNGAAVTVTLGVAVVVVVDVGVGIVGSSIIIPSPP